MYTMGFNTWFNRNRGLGTLRSLQCVPGGGPDLSMKDFLEVDKKCKTYLWLRP